MESIRLNRVSGILLPDHIPDNLSKSERLDPRWQSRERLKCVQLESLYFDDLLEDPLIDIAHLKQLVGTLKQLIDDAQAMLSPWLPPLCDKSIGREPRPAAWFSRLVNAVISSEYQLQGMAASYSGGQQGIDAACHVWPILRVELPTGEPALRKITESQFIAIRALGLANHLLNEARQICATFYNDHAKQIGQIASEWLEKNREQQHALIMMRCFPEPIDSPDPLGWYFQECMAVWRRESDDFYGWLAKNYYYKPVEADLTNLAKQFTLPITLMGSAREAAKNEQLEKAHAKVSQYAAQVSEIKQEAEAYAEKAKNPKAIAAMAEENRVYSDGEKAAVLKRASELMEREPSRYMKKNGTPNKSKLAVQLATEFPMKESTLRIKILCLL